MEQNCFCFNEAQLSSAAFCHQQVKNSFISLLIDVQNRQKEHRELLRKKKKIRSTTTTGPNGQRTTSTHVPGTVSHVTGRPKTFRAAICDGADA